MKTTRLLIFGGHLRKKYYDDGEDAIAMVKYFPGGEDYETLYIRN